ncbi:YcaO-like family protein [Streptomyces sp. NPDC056672]|uniref:YcaO-like family protein n=1 Tax=Streptomyces sp. NPDC056672 TaxID=3345906 RepID=UPI0036A24E29
MSRIVLDGTVRVRPPEETWRTLEPELERLGIARVACLTGLDHLGIPVWTAIRPRSHTLVTSQGKGASDILAKISAVLESAELWHAEQPWTTAPVRGSYRDLEPPYPMALLPVKFDHESLGDVELDWVTGTGLTSGQDIPVSPAAWPGAASGVMCHDRIPSTSQATDWPAETHWTKRSCTACSK